MRFTMRSIGWLAVFISVLGWAAFVEARQVRWVTYGTHENLEQIAALFMKDHPDIELLVETYPYNDYPTKVVTMIAGGAAPDIIQAWAQYKPEWVENKLLLDLTPFWDQRTELASTILPFALEAAQHNGRYYGVPHDFNMEAWIVQPDLFNAAGLPIPYDNWTVSDLKDYAVRLTDPRGRWLGAFNPIAFGWMSSWQWTRNWTGQGWLSDDRQSVLVDSPEQVDMVNFFLELAWSNEVMNGGPVTAARDEMMGGYAMWQGWVDYSFQIARSGAYDFQLATMPRAAFGSKSFGQGHMWSIPINAPNSEDAMLVLDWLLSPTGQQAMVGVGNRQPLTPDPELWDMYFSQLPGDLRVHVQRFVLETLFGQDLIDTMAYWETWGPVNEVMVQYLAAVFTRVDMPASAMHNAAREIRGILADSKSGAH